MSDFETFRRDVEAQIVPPDFADLQAVSRRRRALATAWIGASVVAAVSLVSLGVHDVLAT